MLHGLLRGGGLGFIIYIAYIAQPGSSLFSLHPLLMTITFTGLMTEGVMAFSKSGLAGDKLHSTRVTFHWALLGCAGVAHAVAYAAIYYTKESLNKPHITSWHGTFGLAASILLWLQLSAGVFAKYPRLLKNFVSVKIVKTCHGLMGTLTYTAAMMTILLSFWSVWFQTNAPTLVFYLAISLHLVLMFVVGRKFIVKYGVPLLK